MNIVSFPTQGEVLQFAYDAFGVLPRKHEKDDHFDETRKKSTQTALRRLADEVGQLDENLGKLITTFSYLVAGVLPLREFLAFGDIFFDLFDTYGHVLKTQGTFLAKPKTTEWFVLETVAPRLAISLAKHLQRYNVAADELAVPPEAFWYLPKREGETWRFPLERVMRWSYDLVGTSIQGFHCPDDADQTLLGKNLESAKNWLAGRSLPSWSSLLRNFEQSLEALDRSRAKQGLPSVPDVHKLSIRTALFLSRAATYVSTVALEHLGSEALDEFCNRYRLVAGVIEDNTSAVHDFVHEFIARDQLPASEWDRVWFEVTTDYWKKLAERQDLLSHGVASGTISIHEAKEARGSFGRLVTLPFEHPTAFAPLHTIPAGFGELLLEGFALRKSTELSVPSIHAYSARLDNYGLLDAIAWMTPWLHSTYHYRRGRYDEAYPFMRDAYERAQYSAGTNQYLLVNQYIELCAKNGKWKEFTHAIRWGRYLGIDVRWLRDSQPTQERLELVFELMKKVTYPY